MLDISWTASLHVEMSELKANTDTLYRRNSRRLCGFYRPYIYIKRRGGKNSGCFGRF